MAVGPYWVGDKPLEPVSVYVMRDGVPVDLTPYSSATALLTDPDDVLVAGAPSVVLAGDHIELTWPTDQSLFTQPGWYTLQVALSSGGSSDRIHPINFEVQAPEPTTSPTWADERDVLTYTGVSVSGSVLMQAQGVIEMYAGASYDSAATLTDRNRRLLKQAVAYQAAFMHPDMNQAVFSRADASSVNQDGMNVSMNSDGWVLAPLAKRALSQVKWTARSTGDKTIQVNAKRRQPWDEDESTWMPRWQPLDRRV